MSTRSSSRTAGWSASEGTDREVRTSPSEPRSSSVPTGCVRWSPARVRPSQYHERPPQLCGYYSYWSGLPVEGRFEVYVRDDRGFAAAPTNDGLTLVVGGWPYAQLEANKSDVEGHYLAMFDRAPEFAERIRGATP